MAVRTKIDGGTIWVNRDTVVAKPGDAISMQLASLLSKLNIKPIEAGIAVNFIDEGLPNKGLPTLSCRGRRARQGRWPTRPRKRATTRSSSFFFSRTSSTEWRSFIR
ncbi:MAG: hypothetical protein ACREAY_04240 [Nitrososphaera sp.]|uniref:hypothetical protein n=1 Tax=Nitrososphaera sp. TaxID=1971748 RepID=UPI003D6EC852